MHSIDQGLPVNNVAALAGAAKALVTGQRVPDSRSPERAALTRTYSQHGGGVGLMTDYVIDQVAASVVPAPNFLSAPVPAQAG